MNEPEAHISSPLQLRAERDETMAEEMWRFRHPEEGGEKLTFEAILVEVPLRYGIVVSSMDTLSRFYRWLKVRRDFRENRDEIRQFKEELAKDPSITRKQIEDAGQLMFLTSSAVKRDAKVFANFVKIGQGDRKLDQNEKRLKQTDKSLEMESRRVALLERKAKAMDEAAEQMRLLKAGGKLMPEAERAAILDKMDEILGLKK